MQKYDNADALATALGVETATIKKTLATYNEFVTKVRRGLRHYYAIRNDEICVTTACFPISFTIYTSFIVIEKHEQAMRLK